MRWNTTAHAMWSILARVFASAHRWDYDGDTGRRQCRVCGRCEDLALDIMSTDWDLIEPGDASLHANGRRSHDPHQPRS